MISIISSIYRSDKHIVSFLNNSKRLQEELKKNNVVFEQILVLNDATDFELDSIKKSGVKLKIINTERESIYASWNRGVKASTGDFLTFWGVDDIRYSRAIITALKLIKADEIAYFPFIYKRYVKIFGISILAKVKIVKPANFNKDKFRKEMHAGPHFIAGRRCFDTVGLFNPSFKIAGDFDWIVRATNNNINFVKINIISGVFNNDGSTLSGSKNKLQKEENNIIFKK